MARSVARALLVGHHGLLGDFQLQPVGRKADLVEHARDALGQLGVLELARRHVHRHRHGVRQHGLAGTAQHPVAGVEDEAGVLKDVHEGRRHLQPGTGPVPAQQRLDGADAVLVQVDQRLEMQLELDALQPAVQGHLRLDDRGDALLDVLREEAEGRARPHRHPGRRAPCAVPSPPGRAPAGAPRRRAACTAACATARAAARARPAPSRPACARCHRRPGAGRAPR